MLVQSAINIIMLVVACEALVQLWFHAAPLQEVRCFLVRATPFLYSKTQEMHPLNCKYCVSVWVGVCMAGTYFYMGNNVVFCLVVALVIGRMSNYIHLGASYLNDKQMDLRTARGKNGN